MKGKRTLFLLACSLLFCAVFCACKNKIEKYDMLTIQNYVPKNAVIAHRGTPYWAPESTEAAYRWARTVGADYLEGDLQLTNDGTIVVIHDDNIHSKSDVHQKFPNRNRGTADEPIYYVKDFSLDELLTLDVGTWFNNHPARQGQARAGYAGEKILTLKDLVKIAEGYRIERDANGAVSAYAKDEKDNGNRPGIYLETKQPKLNEGIELVLFKELSEYGWNILEKPATEIEFYKNGKVNVGNTNGKLVLQSFSRKSLEILKSITEGKIPTLFLLWYDPMDESGDSLRDLDEKTYDDYIRIALDLRAQFIGPSIKVQILEGQVTGSVYEDLLTPWMSKKIREAGLYVHPYTFDERTVAMEEYYERCEGMFTNLSDLTAQFYLSKSLRDADLLDTRTASEILDDLGYAQ